MTSTPTRPAIGFVTPPAWYDPGPEELRGLAGDEVAVQQTILDAPDFAYNDLARFAHSVPDMARATRLLALAGCDVICHTGTPFGFAGTTSEAGMLARAVEIGGECGALVVLSGTAILDALRALGARRIAVATPYYKPQWRDMWATVLRSTELEVLAVQSLDQQGLSQPITAMEDLGWSMTDEHVAGSVAHLYQAFPEADAIVLTGSGCRTMGRITALEAMCGGKPVVASDSAPVWRALQLLKIRPDINAFGQLGTL